MFGTLLQQTNVKPKRQIRLLGLENKPRCQSEDKMRYLYVHREEEDLKVSPHNLALFIFWMSHVNVELVTASGWILYLCKYITKGMALDSVGLKGMGTLIIRSPAKTSL